jgi:hypothetical protein
MDAVRLLVVCDQCLTRFYVPEEVRYIPIEGDRKMVLSPCGHSEWHYERVTP